MTNRTWNRNVLSKVVLGFLFLGVSSTWSMEVLTNHWYVELDGDGGIESAKQVAKRTGFTYLGPVSTSMMSFDFR